MSLEPITPECGMADAFADGELRDAEAKRFQDHLAGGCARCERRLETVLVLAGLAQEHGVSRENVVHPLAWHQRSRAWIGGAAALAAAAALLLLVRPKASDDDPLQLGRTRPIEARLTHRAAREHRPYDVPRAGSTEPPKPAPLSKLAELEKRGDHAGVAAGYLLHGDPGQAQAFLARAAASPDVESDRAAVLLVKGEPEDALRVLDGVLSANASHPQALWNRALALNALGLELAAAEAFADVAALREKGWADEARDRSEAIKRAIEARRRSYDEDWTAGRAMISGGGPLSAETARFRPGLSRLLFYDAVRAAPSASRVRDLLPLAKALDQRSGGTALQAYAERIAKRDFTHRAALAKEYARLAAAKPDAAAWTAALPFFLASKEDDLTLGALVQAKAVQQHLDQYVIAAGAQRDPWFSAIAAQESAKALVARGELLKAERMLLAALDSCRDARLEYRCALLESDLSDLYATLHRTVEGYTHARAGLELARAGREWFQEAQLLQPLAQMARFRGAMAVARGHLREAALRTPENCRVQNHVREALAGIALFELKAEEARRELDGRVACAGQPLSLHGAMVLADLSRLAPRKGDLQQLQAGLSALRASGTLSPGGAALADQIEGRLVIDRDRAAGDGLLRKAIAAADKLPAWDEDGRKARAYSYAALALDAGKEKNFPAVLAILAEEARVQPPSRCVVGVAVDDARSVIALRSGSGQSAGVYDAARTRQDALPALPATLAAVLRDCAQVQVLARPPLHGRSGLLSPELAWSYFVKGRPAPRTQAEAHRLLVADVKPPPALGLPALRPWTARPADAVELRGPDATPARVMAEAARATEIELHVHGLVDSGVSDASLLVLTPGPDGDYALTARSVRTANLSYAPIVVLAACHAAQPSAALHAAWSLPVAFIEAGARAVLASPALIGDQQAAPFFDAVLERIRRGEPPAIALRAERLAWRGRPGGGWVDHVLVFE